MLLLQIGFYLWLKRSVFDNDFVDAGFKQPLSGKQEIFFLENTQSIEYSMSCAKHCLPQDKG